jgi:hypothetical protein
MKIPKPILIGLYAATIALAIAAWWWRESLLLGITLQLAESLHLAGKFAMMMTPHKSRRVPQVARRK